MVYSVTAYYNQHLSIIRSNNTIQKYSDILKNIYSPGIEWMPDRHFETALVFSEKIKSFLTRMILQSQLIQLDETGKYLQNEINQILIRSLEDSTETSFIKSGRILEQFNRYKDSLRRIDPEQYTRAFGFPSISFSDLLKTLEPG